MIVKALSENTGVSPEFKTEHGLSLYIETEEQKILFDTGESGIFLENAEMMGVNLADVDIAVLSHGHSDHGGGIKLFLEKNTKAPVYVHPKAFEKHYSIHSDRMEYIGLDEELAGDTRVIPTSDRFFIKEGIELFSNIREKEYLPKSNKLLLEERDGFLFPDEFEHEQDMVIRESGKTVLFTGCSHNGVVNIVNHYYSIKKSFPDYVIGGFHLTNPSTGKTEDESLIKEIGEILKRTGSKYYTCHCTGAEAYAMLKSVMGESISYLAAGGVLEI